MFATVTRLTARRGGQAGDSWDLDRDGTMRIPRGAGATVIRVDRGVVLVTREGDLDDHVLEAGMELRVSGPGLVVAWALEPSTLRVREASAPRRAA